MLLVRERRARRQPFPDRDRAWESSACWRRGLVLLGFVVFLAFESYDQ